MSETGQPGQLDNPRPTVPTRPQEGTQKEDQIHRTPEGAPLTPQEYAAIGYIDQVLAGLSVQDTKGNVGAIFRMLQGDLQSLANYRHNPGADIWPYHSEAEIRQQIRGGLKTYPQKFPNYAGKLLEIKEILGIADEAEIEKKEATPAPQAYSATSESQPVAKAAAEPTLTLRFDSKEAISQTEEVLWSRWHDSEIVEAIDGFPALDRDARTWSRFYPEDQTLRKNYDEASNHLQDLRKELDSYGGFAYKPLKPQEETRLREEVGKMLEKISTLEQDYRKRYQWGKLLVLKEIDGGGQGSIRLAKVKGGLAGLRGEQSGETAEDMTLVVKIPLGDNADHKRFNAEAIRQEGLLLERLRAKQREIFPKTPSFFVDSTIIDTPEGTPALAMEHAGKTILKSWLDGNITSDQLLKDVMPLYCQTFAVAEALGETTHDKKIGSDLFYHPEARRLIVLDWGVGRRLDPSSPFYHNDRILPVREGIRFLLDTVDKAHLSNSSIMRYPEGFSPDIEEKLGRLLATLKENPPNLSIMEVSSILMDIDNLTPAEIESRLKGTSSP